MSEQPDISMDTDNLYREETITDRRVGSIMRLTPVTIDGDDDASRPVLYLGSTQVMTPAGPLPLNFDLEAGSLKEAVENFAEGAEKEAEATMERLREMQREQASSIVVPGQGGPGAGGLGGMPGGGKIQL